MQAFSVKNFSVPMAVIFPQSKIGFSYPEFFIHKDEEYLHIDVILGSIRKTSKESFDSWWEDAKNNPKTPAELAEYAGFNQEAFESILELLEKGE